MKTPDQNSPSPPEELDPESKAFIDENLEHYGTGLFTDVFNAWPLPLFFSELIFSKEKMKKLRGPLEHYKEYFQEAHPGIVDYVMQKSNPEAVKTFDALVDEYNADLNRMRNEEDDEQAKSFLARAKKLIYADKEK